MKEYGNRTLRVCQASELYYTCVPAYVYCMMIGCRFWTVNGMSILFRAVFGCPGDSSSL